jgi:hypothetical protein
MTRRALALLGACLAPLTPWGALGCGSQCSSGGDSSQTYDLSAAFAQADAGVEGGVDSLMACEACPDKSESIPLEDACVGTCFLGRDSNGYGIERKCASQVCLAAVRDPQSSCDTVCEKLGSGHDRGCSFGPRRSTVTCNYHVNGSCRCTMIDC